MPFLENEVIILNEKAASGLPTRIGERGVITDMYYSSPNYQYLIEFDDSTTAPVKESEINKLTEIDKYYMDFLFTGSSAIHNPTNEEVRVLKADYLHCKAEVEFVNGGSDIVDFDKLIVKEIENVVEDSQGKFTKIGLEIGEFTDDKNRQYGSSVDATYKMIQVLMERYEHDEENYLMPKSLLKHILLQVRMMDKINRVFNNPSGKNEKESPYRDLGGYSLIGIDMVENPRR